MNPNTLLLFAALSGFGRRDRDDDRSSWQFDRITQFLLLSSVLTGATAATTTTAGATSTTPTTATVNPCDPTTLLVLGMFGGMFGGFNPSFRRDRDEDRDRRQGGSSTPHSGGSM